MDSVSSWQFRDFSAIAENHWPYISTSSINLLINISLTTSGFFFCALLEPAGFAPFPGGCTYTCLGLLGSAVIDAELSFFC